MNTHDQDHDFEPFEAPNTTRSFTQVLWQRKAFVILGALIGLGAGFLWYTQETPIYASTAQIVVMKESQVGPGQRDNEGIIADYMATQIQIIVSPRVMKIAFQRGNLGNLKAFEGVSDPINFLRTSFSAARDTDKTGGVPNNCINLSFRCTIADDCPVILGAIISAYSEYLDLAFGDANDRRMEQLRKQLKKIGDDLKDEGEKHRLFREKYNVVYTPSEKSFNPVQELVAKFESKRSDLVVDRTGWEQEIKLFQDEIDKNGGREYGHMLRQKLGLGGEKFDDATKYGEDQLLQIKVAIEKAKHDFGDKHPSVVSLEKQLETMRKHFEDTAPPQLSPEKDPVKRLMKTLEHAKRKLDGHIEAIDRQLVDSKKEAKRLGEIELREYEFKSIRRNLEQLQEGTTKHYQTLEIQKDSNASGRIIVNTLADPSFGYKVSPVVMRNMGMGLVLGLMIGIGLAYLADLADKSFRSPDEIRKQLGLPLVGHIPFFLPDADTAKRRAAGESTIDPMLCCYFKPKSLDSEAYRAVRTTLLFNTQAQGLKIIQVTSPNKGDGKSLLISNLAVTTAQSGKRVLMIDADCRRPRQHKVFNVGNGQGLVNVINGQIKPEDAVQETIIPGLWVLPAGSVPPNPSELLVSPRFKEMLDGFREQYDYVFVDSPPLLAVTDPCIVASNVDGLFLAIRLTRRGRPDAERAREILHSLKVRTFGIVVNGVTRTNAGLYYGQAYDYTDKYMDYEEDEDKAYYYADEDEEAAAEAAADQAKRR